MKILIYILLTIFLSINKGNADVYKCIKSAKKYEKVYKLPENLLVSVALTESGKRLKSGDFVAWPWTINIKGKGKFFETKDLVLKYVENYLKKGKKNIDMGCMQVNYMYHPKAFNNLSLAFDPETNVKWSANLIKNLFEKYGSYREAVGYYHSYRTSKKNKYSSKVFRTWEDLNKNNIYAHLNTEPKEIVQLVLPEENLKIEKVKVSEIQPIHKFKKDHKILKHEILHKKKVNSTYILARMEKVRFFRNYFLKY